MKNIAIVLAGGQSLRFNNKILKQFQTFNNMSLIDYCLLKFEQHEMIDEIILVLPYSVDISDYSSNYHSTYKKLKSIILGGKTRQESSYIAVNHLDINTQNVIIHDVARPLVPDNLITDIIKSLENYYAVLPVIPAIDTVYSLSNGKSIDGILNRDQLGLAQTPQGFKQQIILQAHDLAKKNGKTFSDDIGMIYHYGLAEIKTIQGSDQNIKITNRIDFDFFQFLLR